MEIQRYWFDCVVAIGVLAFCYFTLRFLFRILHLVLCRKFDMELKIGRISFFSIHGIYLHLKNGTTLEIEKVWITSRLCHMEFMSLFAVCISDIRLKGNFAWIASGSRKTNSDPEAKKSFFSRLFTWLIVQLLSWKFFSIHLFNVKVVELGKVEEGFWVYLYTKKLVVYFTTNTEHMEINVPISSAFLNVYRLSPLEMYLLIESFTLQLMNKYERRTFELNVMLVEIEFKRNDALDNFNTLYTQFTFSVSDVHAANDHDQFAHLSKAEANVKVEDKIINSKFDVTSFTFSYNKDALQYWLSPINSSEETELSGKEKELQSSNSYGFVDFLNHFRLQIIAQLDGIDISMKIPGYSMLSLELGHLWLSSRDRQSGTLYDVLVKSLVGRNFSFDYLLESGYVKLGEETLADSAILGDDFWIMLYPIGLFLLKIKVCNEDLTAECLMDTILSYREVLVETGYLKQEQETLADGAARKQNTSFWDSLPFSIQITSGKK